MWRKWISRFGFVGCLTSGIGTILLFCYKAFKALPNDTWFFTKSAFWSSFYDGIPKDLYILLAVVIFSILLIVFHLLKYDPAEKLDAKALDKSKRFNFIDGVVIAVFFFGFIVMMYHPTVKFFKRIIAVL